MKDLIGINKTELISVLLVFVLIFVSVAGARLLRLTSVDAIIFEQEVEIIFDEKTGLDTLQEKLLNLGVTVQADLEELRWAAGILGWRNFQRGRYEFDGGVSYNGFLSKMARGIQDPVPVVILPGITLERFAETVSTKLHFEKQDIVAVLTDSTFISEKGADSKEHLFGRMLPETYLLYWTATPETVINRILREYDSAITQNYSERAEELSFNMDELVTLASIVEWEANRNEEKARISGLYWNRLNRGMRLQADPTVNYAIGERRRLLFEDYEFDHPFNTYVNDGLPPGPITNPSRSTIEATLYPEDHNYLYMVASPEGGHVFTETFREHQVESEKWRIWLRQQYQIRDRLEAEKQNSPETP